ncbi:zinc-dependent peptidase [Hydrogenophaga sp.]|uniref:M90 family metallopeptidase n=1 Tax=Hydrogenophaga sp. TaxID=1904254 RepID=UPI00272FC659|nr:M90 family metallopeptidase [Hydrogenophaga sp.]MDP2015516.1 zinc-dependent peptidase [Hydrogenophaga sp.]MDP3164231.1 zinc-dependent peptidase [Hydrogenophaga sp.]
MIDLLQRLLPRSLRQPTPVPDALWRTTLNAHPFLSALDAEERGRLRLLCTHFLAEKEFHGANELALTDAMALAIAAQACLPLLHMHGTSGEAVRDPLKLLDWYGDFVGIVVQPGAVVARRKTTDGAGVVHHHDEVLAGEAMDRGPLMLSWEEVAHASVAAESGSNVVIHEFVHKMDMRGISLGEHPDGAPPLPKGFMGTRSGIEARSLWRQTMQVAFDEFRDAVTMAQRFGAQRPWLDDYAAKDPAEFFAVTCEAYFVSRHRFAQEFPALVALYDGFFRPASSTMNKARAD